MAVTDGAPYPAQEEWPGAAPDPEQESQRSRGAAILVAVALLVVAAVVFAFWHMTRPPQQAPVTATTPAPTSTTSRAPASTTSPAQTSATSTTQSPATVTKTVTASPTLGPEVMTAARQIEGLLSESAGQRSLVVGAVTCSSDPGQAVDHLNEALMGRDRLYQRVDDMPFDNLPHGRAMSRELSKAWELSKYADQNFLEWATDRLESGQCRLDSEAYQAGVGQSATAQRHKKAFVKLWEEHVRGPLKLATKRTSANI